jgi:hypothetical protein
VVRFRLLISGFGCVFDRAAGRSIGSVRGVPHLWHAPFVVYRRCASAEGAGGPPRLPPQVLMPLNVGKDDLRAR